MYFRSLQRHESRVRSTKGYASNNYIIVIRSYFFSHAKVQSFAKRLRGSAQSACNIFTQESTDDTEFSTDCGYLQVFFEPLMARIFTNALRSGLVSHKIHGRHRIPLERICLTQTAQIFADKVYLSILVSGKRL